MFLVKKGGGAVWICVWLIGTPVPFVIDQISPPIGDLTVSRQRSLASIVVGVETCSAVVLQEVSVMRRKALLERKIVGGRENIY